jgi:hypothetical protein
MIFSTSCLEFLVVDICLTIGTQQQKERLINFFSSLFFASFLHIDWDARCVDDIGNDALINVDGTDFMIPEQDPYFFSHQFKNYGLC